MKEIEEWKEKVLQCVNSHIGTTFVNLVQDLGDEAKGDYDIIVPGCKNLVIWSQLDKGLVEAIAELQLQKKICFQPESVFIYAMDGMILPLQVAYEKKDYPTAHWCPMAIYPCFSKIDGMCNF